MGYGAGNWTCRRGAGEGQPDPDYAAGGTGRGRCVFEFAGAVDDVQDPAADAAPQLAADDGAGGDDLRAAVAGRVDPGAGSELPGGGSLVRSNDPDGPGAWARRGDGGRRGAGDSGSVARRVLDVAREPRSRGDRRRVRQGGRP